MTGKGFTCSFIALCFLVPVARGWNTTLLGSLEDDLLSGYKPTIRPQERTDVGVSFGLMHINSLDIVEQTIDIVGFLMMGWLDERLMYDPTLYDNATSTFIKQSNLWVPNFVLNNAADGMKIMTDNSDASSNFATVQQDGSVELMLADQFVAQCTIHIRFYPFDKQECQLLITPYSYAMNQLLMYVFDEHVNLDLYERNGEWDIYDSNFKNHTRSIGSLSVAAARLTLILNRKYSYYLLNLILPVVLLAVLGTLVFLLPVESGEKNGFSLTILLSMSVMMTLVSDNIPPIATQTCLLSIYLLIVFVVCMFETACTVFSCQIHQWTASGHTPARRWQALAAFGARIAFYSPIQHEEENEAAIEKEKEDMKKRRQSKMSSPSGVKIDPQAWEERSDDGSENAHVFSFEEIALLFDRINFIFYFVLTMLLTIVFMAVIVSGA